MTESAAKETQEEKVDLLEIAHHEAAHAVFHFDLGWRLTRVTIQPDQQKGTLGHAAIRRPKWIHNQPVTQREAQRLRLHAAKEILSSYAGRIAQAKYAGREIDWGYDGDFRHIVDLALSFISGWEDVYQAYVVYCEKQAARMVECLWPEIQAVAHALMERKSLTGRQVREVIVSIPDEVIEAHRKLQGEALEREQERLEAEDQKQNPDADQPCAPERN